MINLLKKLPIDLGQRYYRYKSKGKKIAMSLVPLAEDNEKVLDAGCGTGFFSVKLKEKGYDVVSIDIESDYPRYIKMDLNKDLPFDDKEFDGVWNSEVLEHVDDPMHLIKEFRRIVKKWIIVTTPNSYCLLFRFLALFGLTSKKIQREEHKHFFDIKKVRELFPTADIYGFFPYILFKFKIKRFVGALSPTFVIYENM